jgi:hypothetical protein
MGIGSAGSRPMASWGAKGSKFKVETSAKQGLKKVLMVNGVFEHKGKG